VPEHFGFTFNSAESDEQLYNVSHLILRSVLNILPREQVEITEYKIGNTYLYRFCTRPHPRAGELIAYVGRDRDTGNLKYLMVDNARFRWAKLEGFNFTKGDVFDKIGAMRRLKSINDMIYFLTMQPFKCTGDYIYGNQ
jgi:hypothetical protein